MGSSAHPDDSRADSEVVRARMLNPLDLSPRWLTVHPTDRCNHKCDWCWYERTSDSAAEAELLTAVTALVDCGVHDIAVSGGGEPTLFRAFDNLIRTFKDLVGVRRKLYTNGSRLSRFDDVADAFDYVRVSLDAGGPEAHALEHGCDAGEYYRILESLAEIGSRTEVGVSAVVTDRNAASIPELVGDCERFGVPALFLKPLLVGLEREVLPGLSGLRSESVDIHFVRDLGEYEELPRAVAALPLLLAPDGFVYPCAHASGPQFRLGSLTEVSEPGWAGSAMKGAVIDMYASFPHACRAFDAWLDFVSAQEAG